MLAVEKTFHQRKTSFKFPKFDLLTAASEFGSIVLSRRIAKTEREAAV
jgi:hypothetical protein